MSYRCQNLHQKQYVPLPICGEHNNYFHCNRALKCKGSYSKHFKILLYYFPHKVGFDFSCTLSGKTLRKHAYLNILKILPPKNENFQIKNSYILHISYQNIDCGYALEPPHWGSSNAYPQSMFLSRNKKNNVYPCKPQFYYIKVGFKGVKIIWACFRDDKYHPVFISWICTESAKN